MPIPTSTPVSFATFTRQIFEYIEANYPDFDWANYDNRTNSPNWVYDNSTSDPDGKVDYIVISFRWNKGRDPWSPSSNPTYMLQTHSYNGADAVAGIMSGKQIVSNSGTYSLSTGYTIFSGLRGEMSYNELFLHEYGHNLYDAPHYNGANGVLGKYFYGMSSPKIWLQVKHKIKLYF